MENGIFLMKIRIYIGTYINKFKVNSCNKYVTIKLYIGSLKVKFNKLTSSKWKVLYNLKNHINIVIKGADKWSVIAVNDRKNVSVECYT